MEISCCWKALEPCSFCYLVHDSSRRRARVGTKTRVAAVVKGDGSVRECSLRVVWSL